MSQILTRSPKHCAQRGFHFPNLNKKLLYTSFSILLSIISFILLLWFILHPTNPHFTLLQAQIYQLNLSNPNHLLSSSIQLTLESKNPNTKVGAYYDELKAYASYKGQPITAHVALPPFFQGQQESNVFSASLGASGLPVAPSFGFDVGRDQVAGKMVVVFKVDGRLRWKIGSWVSGGYRIDVDCVAVLPVGASGSLTASSSGQLGAHCDTNC
ncbi:hypothetical protein V2J09_004727 [Rumex salicifolius]